MATKINQISERKKNHIDICLTQDVDYIKSNGFEQYEFEHFASTEVQLKNIDLSAKFFGQKINLPFLVSCMTGGTEKAMNINTSLAIFAEELNIPVGVGSQREVLEGDEFAETFASIKNNAPNVPRLSNIGAAQIAQIKSIDPILKIIDQIEASALVIHLNPLQELIQHEGEPDFKGLHEKLYMICSKLTIPVVVKEVGAGISKSVAKGLLDSGVRGIDVAGAGGTSWSAVEMLRKNNEINEFFWNWGLPTSYCLRTVAELKKDKDFVLISSGGISKADEVAKSIALGADLVGSAKLLLRVLDKSGIDGLKKFIVGMFEDVKKIMYLTGCSSIKELKRIKLIKHEELY